MWYVGHRHMRIVLDARRDGKGEVQWEIDMYFD
jgi:hypothetical protein